MITATDLQPARLRRTATSLGLQLLRRHDGWVICADHVVIAGADVRLTLNDVEAFLTVYELMVS